MFTFFFVNSYLGLRMRYFGTGETFLFKFQRGSILTKYEWVKKSLSDEEEDGTPKKKERAKELFMSADNSMVTVGGGWVECMINMRCGRVVSSLLS